MCNEGAKVAGCITLALCFFFLNFFVNFHYHSYITSECERIFITSYANMILVLAPMKCVESKNANTALSNEAATAAPLPNAADITVGLHTSSPASPGSSGGQQSTAVKVCEILKHLIFVLVQLHPSTNYINS